MGFFSFLFPKKEPKRRTSFVQSGLSLSPYVIIDVETTGLKPYSDKIIQLSAIRYARDGTPADFYDTYLNPGRPIPKKASAINGITDNMVKNAPTIQHIHDRFLSFIGDNLLVGYNVTFDLQFLNNAFEHEFEGRQYVDVLPIARHYLITPDYKLETVATSIGFVPEGGFHDSFSDCEAVAFLLHEIGISLHEWSREFHPTQTSRTKEFSYAKLSYTPHFFTGNEPESVRSHPFFMKTIVFTGILGITRDEAAQLAADNGAIIRYSVSGKTDYLVVGQQDYKLVGEGGMSTKEKKAVSLNLSGKAHIRIIHESEFLSLLHFESEV